MLGAHVCVDEHRCPPAPMQGHHNGKNFVGMSVLTGDGAAGRPPLLACGSETESVYVYGLPWGSPLATRPVAASPPASLSRTSSTGTHQGSREDGSLSSPSRCANAAASHVPTWAASDQLDAFADGYGAVAAVQPSRQLLRHAEYVSGVERGCVVAADPLCVCTAASSNSDDGQLSSSSGGDRGWGGDQAEVGTEGGSEFVSAVSWRPLDGGGAPLLATGLSNGEVRVLAMEGARLY